MRKSIFVFAMILGMMMIPQVQCQDQQTLSWGVTEDLKIRYSVTKTSVFTPYDEPPLHLFESYEMVASFSYFPEIREHLVEEIGIPTTLGVTTLLNGSDTFPSILVYPIGNWELVEEIDSDTLYHTALYDFLKNATYFEDDLTWGRRFNYTDLRQYDYDPSTYLYCNVTRTEVFSKTDGAIVHQETILDFWWYSTPHNFGTVIQTIGRLETITPDDLDNLPIVIIIGGSFAAIALIAIYWVRR